MAEIMRDTQRFLHFNLSHTGDGEDNHYVDLAKLLSQCNRRSYRQGMVYHVANIVFDDADGDADIDVCTAPQNWTTQAAWQLGFKNWIAQQRNAMDSIDEPLGTWSDFKVCLNDDMRDDVDQAALIDVNGNSFGVGDWTYSKFILPDDGGADPNSCDIDLMGNYAGTYPAHTRVTLLRQLELSMRKPQEDPDIPSGVENSVYALMSHNQPQPLVLKEVLKDIETDNDMPPYDHDAIQGAGTAGTGRPSSPWVARTTMIRGGSSGSGPVSAVGGFAAPCGLIMIETNCSDDNSIGCTIELVPGEYKGVHAYPMRGGGY